MNNYYCSRIIHGYNTCYGYFCKHKYRFFYVLLLPT